TARRFPDTVRIIGLNRGSPDHKRRTWMKRIFLIALAAALSLAIPLLARQAATNAAVAPVDQHLKLLAEKLDLTASQQEKARPILQQMHDDSQKVMDDKSLSHEEAMSRMHPVFMKADKSLRE